MFDANDLSNLDPNYFSIISTDAFDVTIMSRNTGHFWFIHNPEYPTPGNCIIFHKHKASAMSQKTIINVSCPICNASHPSVGFIFQNDPLCKQTG